MEEGLANAMCRFSIKRFPFPISTRKTYSITLFPVLNLPILSLMIQIKLPEHKVIDKPRLPQHYCTTQ